MRGAAWVAAGCLTLAACALPFRSHHATPTVTVAERNALLRRAQIWTSVDVASMNMTRGPQDRPFPPGATVTCDFVEKDFDGDDPKFACALDDGEVVKVRYGRDNGEVYAGVAATRLLWALGFGADALYPVRVICRGCPEYMRDEGMATEKTITFDVAAIERQHPGGDIIADGLEGWAWPELDRVDAAAGGAPLAQRDALKLLASMLQHVDSKAVQQRLVCLDPERPPGPLAACSRPFMLIHDAGHTFGHARVLDTARPRASVREWSSADVWKDATRCVANISPAANGTLRDPVISEQGRLFLSHLLDGLTSAQLHDLFAVARFDRQAHAGDSIDAWTAAFERKHEQIRSARCGHG